MEYIGIAVVVAVVVIWILVTRKRNMEIGEKGIVTDAVVKRIEERESDSEDNGVQSTTYTYIVKYRTQDGRDVEAKMGSEKSVALLNRGTTWDRDLQVGSTVQIKYLPEKPYYVVRVDDKQ